MYLEERQKEILSFLREKKRCSVRELAETLFVSEATIRRDLHQLAADGKVQKTFGGAIICENFASEIPFSVRSLDNLETKQSICRQASALIQEGMTLFMDGSTTPEHLVPYLFHFRELQIITNNPRIPLLLSNTPLKIYCTGGMFNHTSQLYAGSIAERTIANMNADLFFFSARGVDANGKITDSSPSEHSLKQLMLANAKVSCFLCGHQKFNTSHLFTVSHCKDIDYVFSDVPLTDALLGKEQK